MSEAYIADTPVSLRDEDDFQRYDFAKRIAKNISSRTNTDNIVFGLYGKWGEGKSSVLKFIENELDPNKTLQVHFNPWRYNDEDSILMSFFNQIAEVLEIELEMTSEKAKQTIKKYSAITKVFGFDIEGITNLISDRNVEHFKSKTEEILKKSEKKLVIFIDDIDRLDKDELFTLFRLIKLTADFSNTVYIFSFDKEMVAKAIGQRFGNGDHNDGANFLEKIIQIPIELPDFRHSELREYTLRLLNEVLQKNNIELNEAEQNQYTESFDNCLFHAINTPRSAIRYRNALEFSVPLLKDEVNMVDFIIFEGLKIFYPGHVAYIKSNPETFIHNYIKNNKLYFDVKEEVKEDKKEEIEELHQSLHESTQSGICSTLISIFPKLKRYYPNYSGFSEQSIETLQKDKRIATADYFERYLSYSLAKNEISDVKFTTFIESLAISSDEDISKMANEFITKTSMYAFLEKLRLVENNLSWGGTQKLIIFLFNNSHLLKEDEFSFFDLSSSVRQATYFITRQLNKIEDSSLAHKFLIENMESIENKQFLINFLQVGIYDKNVSEGLFSEDQIKEIYQSAINCTLNTLEKNQYLIEKYPIISRTILFFWIKIDKNEAGKHISGFVNASKSNVLEVLKSLAGRTMVTSNGDRATTNVYISDFDKESFDFLKSMKCVDDFNDGIHKLYSADQLDKHELLLSSLRQEPNTEINLVSQFIYYFEEDKTNDKRDI